MADYAKPQVRNLVFDMGGIFLNFDGTQFASFYTDSVEDARLIDEALFSSPSWPLLDAGAISEDTIERIAAASLPERLVPAMRETFAHWHEHEVLLPGANELVARLHAAGYGCYLLSNAGTRFWRQKERIACFPLMDGWVVSSYEHVMKPDPLLYRILCNRYGLVPEECLFVDDREINVRGAEVAGMQGHVYTTADDLESYLLELGLTF